MNDIFYTISSYNLINQFGGAKKAKKKWTTLKHNGVLFPPPYIKHDIPVIYNNKQVSLNIIQEEYATLYSKYIETDYVTNSTFKKNFWKDWKEVLGRDHEIQSLDGCDFSKIYDYLLKIKEEKKTISNEEKELLLKEEEKYKIAIVDGKEQPVGNYRVEPPGIFIGRGCNPKMGRVKKRLYPEDFIINIGKGEEIPKPIDGHKWGQVIHDNTVEWLASWKDDITDKIKYVWLGAHSDFKAKSDINKFNLAKKLKRKIKTIRETNDKELKSKNLFMRQIATALYFIDNFALRVGNEKGEDETDTVGVTSLRVEHIKLLDNYTVELDFMGKDYIRYKRTLIVSPDVYNNLEEFTKNKHLEDNIFDQINSSDVNRYLQSFMPNLTAKVFRTYNASNLFQKELAKVDKKFSNYNGDDKVNLLLDEFNKANAKVALLCNHQKNVTSNTNKQIENIDMQIKKLRDKKKQTKKSKSKTKTEKIETINDKIDKLKAKKQLKLELKNVALGTSKINYIDPRITVSFMKKHDFPVDKIFSKALQEKFKWAFDVDEKYTF